MEYYLLTAKGEEGPYREEELLDLLDAGEVRADELCEQRPSGVQRPLGEWFEVVVPDGESDESCEPVGEGGGEMIHWEGRRSLLMDCWWWVLGGFVFWLAAQYERQIPGVARWGLGVGAVIWLGVLVRASRWQYRVRAGRVEVLHGWFFKDSWEMLVAQIHSLQVAYPGFRGVLGVGDVSFTATDGEDATVVFRGVRRPHEIKELVRRLQAAGRGAK